MIRYAIKLDASTIDRIYRKSWPYSAQSVTTEATAAYLSFSDENYWEERIANPNNTVVVYEVDGSVEGFFLVRPSEHSSSAFAELDYLFINPDLRGTGIGSVLFSEFIKQADSDSRYEDKELWVISDNFDAQKFYLNRGWSFTGESYEIDSIVWNRMLMNSISPSN
jgi:GNAT superfamily N-acetyltransferase